MPCSDTSCGRPWPGRPTVPPESTLCSATRGDRRGAPASLSFHTSKSAARIQSWIHGFSHVRGVRGTRRRESVMVNLANLQARTALDPCLSSKARRGVSHGGCGGCFEVSSTGFVGSFPVDRPATPALWGMGLGFCPSPPVPCSTPSSIGELCSFA